MNKRRVWRILPFFNIIMSFKKIVFLAAFFAILSGVFVVNVHPAKAVTVDELQALIIQLQAKIAQLQQQLTGAPGQPAAFCYDFNINLGFAQSTTAAVKALHTALQKQGFSAGSDITTGVFTENTASAVVGFQQKYKADVLAPHGLQFGTGFVGTTTRAKLNELYGCKGITPPPTEKPEETPVEIPEKPLWDWAYCTAASQCTVEQGDCDTDADCAAGLYCAQNVGVKYGQVSSMDVCEVKSEKSITVLSPNGWEIWQIGATYTIQWSATGYPSYTAVQIGLRDNRYSTELGSGEAVIVNTTNTGSYSFTVPASLGALSGGLLGGTNVYSAIIYVDGGGPGKSDTSNAPFSIVSATTATPSLIITSPGIGETWVGGSQQTIRWQTSGISSQGNINVIELYNIGTDQAWALKYNTPNDGSEVVTVPIFEKPADLLMQIDVTVSGISEVFRTRYTVRINPPSTPFITVSSLNPNGETLEKGTTRYINLKFSPSVPLGGFVINLLRSDIDVAVAVLKFCGTASDYIADNVVPPNVSWQWKVGYAADGKEIPTGSYRVFVYDCGSKIDNVWTGSVAHTKSNVFSIVSATTTTPSVTVLSPNGGESWKVGEIRRISWIASGVNYVRIYIEDDTITGSGSTNYTYDGVISAVQGYYDWTIVQNQLPGGSTLPRNYKIRVDGVNTVAVGADVVARDWSNNTFSIVSLSITSFNYTETDAYGGSIQFSWTSAGADGVELQIACHSGLTSTDAITGANFFCGDIDRSLAPNSSTYLKFTNTSGALINVTATLTPVIGNIGYGTYSKTLNFSIVSGLGLENIENQLASISDAAANLLFEIKKLLGK